MPEEEASIASESVRYMPAAVFDAAVAAAVAGGGGGFDCCLARIGFCF